MISKEFSEYLSNLIGSNINKIQSVSGGDISAAFLLQTNQNNYFLKVNSKPWALDMFKAEAKGLKAILNSNAIATPNVIAFNTFGNEAFLLMDYVETKRASSTDLEIFGRQLAHLHLVTSNEFGFDDNNFIGSLHQSNKKHKTWNDFYIEERLITQLQLAETRGLLKHSEILKTELMKNICNDYFKDIRPSLLHGDLWSGNYFISLGGMPILIDPAVYFGHSEVDIAMSKLFGGFGATFYQAYHEIIPEDEFTKNRIELYQLYYLLVHLNLFGRSYYGSVKSILNKYF